MSDSGTSAKVDQPATPGQSAPRPDDVGTIARDWWRSLQPDTQLRRPGERAALARLRRASPLEAAMQEATFRLFRQLRKVRPGLSQRDLPRVATLATLLAHIRADDPRTPFARAIGRTEFDKGDSAALKPLRFERLVAADGEDEIARAFRRAIAILGGTVNVVDLARTVFYFDREETRRNLAFAYYGAGFAAPAHTDARPGTKDGQPDPAAS
ncbi:MAG: subtype I-E CRISPR-associated protein Cse2 [Saliniramus fredricksonii]|uniref:CRISPR system Cascade subunit CasB n=1 Tax=Saliniramus fredricksonii TaxID=1653334 RepID=A0A0P8A9Y9_9HYPH|nr:type I-E CRISPR-associated protein Cse2/CasB [Saliniramus fredricksonii]KPQ11913.1 MAG: subtype I-E CRISPR-associated protein Cse2 [Saliniramus fredricksonii]SCC81588.1 CRISPR system Cascade subunit CasB [Saliniramus fredricksonii]